MCNVKFEYHGKWSYETFKQEVPDSHNYGNQGVLNNDPVNYST